MVNSINLTMTNKDQIATWKANRRKLVICFQFTRLLHAEGFLGLFNGWNP